MNISYQREMKRNYLIIEAEVQDEVPFEQIMMEQNPIDGVLHFQVREKDTDIRYFYEITSKQPLSRLLEGQSIRAAQIRALVWGIAQALDHMEAYLLSENSVLLTPDYLYVEPENLKVWLCVIPGLERDFPEDYSRFLEYLLGKVDHKDKESVVLAYGLYQETRKENYGMRDILRLAQKLQDGNDTERDPDMEEDDQPGVQQSYETNEPEETVRVSQIQANAVRETGSLFGRWKQRRKVRKEEKQRELEREMQMPWESIFAGETQSDYGTAVSRSEEKGRVRENPGHPEKRNSAPVDSRAKQGNGTVLLNPQKNDHGTGVRRLKALDAGETDIAIAYYPFIIGKQENLVDHVLDRETVSRLHLRIDQKEEHYYVQDLNSTNGTEVDGRMLENNETIEIREGTDISIAGIRYRFL